MIPRKPSLGDPLDRSTQTQGYIIDAVEALREQQLSEEHGDDWHDTKPIGNIAPVLNTDDTDIPWYGIVEVGDSRHDWFTDLDGFKREIYLSGTFPVVYGTGVSNSVAIGIAQEPISVGNIGSVMFSGITQARVNRTHLSYEYKYATPVQGSYALEATEFGPIDILVPVDQDFLDAQDPEWSASLWSVVRLGGGGGSSSCNWGKAQTDWENNTGSEDHAWVSVKSCDSDGENEVGDAFDVWLPRSGCGDPNVVTDDVIAIVRMGDGSWTAISDYLDAQFGEITWFTGPIADIGEGWALCDGNNGTVNLTDRFIVATDSDGVIGTTGGFNSHGPGENNHDKHDAHDVAIDSHSQISPHEGTFTHDPIASHVGAFSHNPIESHTIDELMHDHIPDHENHVHYPAPATTAFDAVAAGTDVVNLDDTDFEVYEAWDWHYNSGVNTTPLFHYQQSAHGPLDHNSIDDHPYYLGHDSVGTHDLGTLTHDHIDDHAVFYLTHEDHTNTDNRPPYYALAAKQRIDNSHT